jgi:hypothetical protein
MTMWHENYTGGSSLYISDDIGIHVDPVDTKWNWRFWNGSEFMSGQAETRLQAQIDAVQTFIYWLNKTTAQAQRELHELIAQTPLARMRGAAVYKDEQGNLVTIDDEIVTTTSPTT